MIKEYNEAIKYRFFWSKLITEMFMSKGKIALWQYLAKKELEHWGHNTDITDWHNIGIVARVAYQVTKI